MKTIYLSEAQLLLIKEFEEFKNEVTFEEFKLNIKELLKDLLKNPSDIRKNDFFSRNGWNTTDVISNLRKHGIIEVSDKIDEVDIEDNKKQAKRFTTYKVPRKNFVANLKKMFNNEYSKDKLNEEGGDGATNCFGVGTGGNAQFITPISLVQRKKFYIDTLKRNEDEDNKSISMNRQK